MKKSNIFRRCLYSFTGIILGWVLVGCQTTPAPDISCSLPTGYNVAGAFAHANSDLAHLKCQYEFDDYLEALLSIAASDPKEKNKEHFSNFLGQARGNGVISQVQAKESYRRYFTADFISLGQLHNNCSTTCRSQPAVVKKLKIELRDKHRGLLEATGDRDGYAQADNEYNQLLTLIEATCLACAD